MLNMYQAVTLSLLILGVLKQVSAELCDHTSSTAFYCDSSLYCCWSDTLCCDSWDNRYYPSEGEVCRETFSTVYYCGAGSYCCGNDQCCLGSDTVDSEVSISGGIIAGIILGVIVGVACIFIIGKRIIKKCNASSTNVRPINVQPTSNTYNERY